MRILLALCLALVPASSFAEVDAVSLFNSIELDDTRPIQKAIDKGEMTADHRIAAPGYPTGAPILVVAARAGALKVVRYLIAKGADLNARTSTGESALMLACFFTEANNEQVARELVSANADLESAPGAFTALAYAAYSGNTRVVDLLLARGAKPDGAPIYGQASVPSPLMMASMNGHRDALRLILRHGADARHAQPGGNDARAIAVKGNQGHLLPLLDCALALPAGQTYATTCSHL